MAAAAPITVAHRGDSHNHPENTAAAFAAAVRLGAGMIEFDVRQAADGTLVCIHDETLDRTTDAGGILGTGVRVADCDATDLARLDAGAWKGERHRGQRIPSLAAALRLMAGGPVPMIEHKDGDPERYVQTLTEAGCLEQVILQSFDWEFVAAAGRLAPQLCLGALGPSVAAPVFDGGVLDRLDRLGACLVHWDEQELRVEDLRTLQARGLLVCTYTTDDDLGLVGGAALGVDAITTNMPARLLALVRTGHARRRA